MSPPVKFFYYSGSRLPSREANAVHVMKMCAALAAEGAQVRLYGFSGDSSGAWDGNLHRCYGVDGSFRVSVLPDLSARGWRHVYGFLNARSALLRGDGIHFGRCIHSVYHAARAGASVVFEAHQPFEHGTTGRTLFEGIVRRKRLTRLVTITRRLADRFCEEFNLPEERVLVLSDGADLPSPEPRPREPGNGGPLTVGYVGHLYAGKGMELIEQLARLMGDCRFEIVGGTEEDLARWRSRLAGLNNIVLHGFVPTAATEEYRRRCDVLVSPCQRRIASSGGDDIAAWTSPLKLFEYMGSRRPIVCSDLPVLREVMHHGHNCLLCPPQDPAAWVAALRRLQADHALARSLADNAYDDLKRNYTWRRRAQRLLQALASPASAVTGLALNPAAPVAAKTTEALRS